MKRKLLLFFCLVLFFTVFAIEKINIFKTNLSVSSFNISSIDSILFTNNDLTLSFFRNDQTVTDVLVSEMDSLTFINISDTVYINFSNLTATVVNPLADSGVDISVSNADVVINSVLADNEICFVVSGTTNEGSLKIYSANKLELILNGVSISNSDGPSINIQSKKKTTICLPVNTVNSLTDGSAYAASTEDQKGTIFSEGQLIFKGNGSLSLIGNAAHAICSDDFIEIENGNITVLAAQKDGIHAKDHFNLEGGTLNISATGDAVDCENGKIKISAGIFTSTVLSADTKGLKCDSTFTMTGGIVNLTVSGNQSKGLKSTGIMSLSGGEITVKTSGAAVLSASSIGYEPSYCTAVKCDSTLHISGASITIVATGVGGKGISASKDLNIISGKINVTTSGGGATYKNSLNVSDAYSANCMSADGNLLILNGTVNCSSSGSGAKAISTDGTITIGDQTNSPTISLKTTGSKFLVSGSDYCHPKTLVSPAAITINNGIIIASSTDDGIHSDTSFTMNGGDLTIQNSYEGIESKYIYLIGGTSNITATNDGYNATMGTVSGGTESNDKSLISTSGGIHFVNCSNGDAIDSNGNITVTGGVTFANGPLSGVEEAVDFNGAFNMNGGVFVGAGSNSNMTKSMSLTSTQSNLFVSSNSQISSSTMMTVAVAGVGVVSFKPKYGAYKFLISAPKMTIGAAYAVYTGGTYTGGTSTNNFFSGGSYSTTGSTTKKSGTLSSSTAVNSISF